MLSSKPDLQEIARSRPEFAEAPRVWHTYLKPELEAREQDRRAAIHKATLLTWTISAVIILPLVFVAIALTHNEYAAMAAGYVGFLIARYATSSLRAHEQRLHTQIKELIVGTACLPLGFDYDPMRDTLEDLGNKKTLLANYDDALRVDYMTDQDDPTGAVWRLRDAALLDYFDSRRFEDHVSGERSGVRFDAVDARLTTGSGSHTTNILSGLLVHAEYPVPFEGRTILMRRGTDHMRDQLKDLQRVRLVSPEWESKFSVWGTDQVAARALLTPDRMERILALEDHFEGGKLRVLFEDGHLTLALNTGNLFEAGGTMKRLADPSRFIYTLHHLGLLCDVIDGFTAREWASQKLQ
ncbi:DUF3137 domain-containing protein [Henriciella sp. AS95]|uniref:DUF3137 domain-containing protein n=1 Tax=Henriciella sp. AS95 TaxID=3135782 RepID=UPI00316CCE03